MRTKVENPRPVTHFNLILFSLKVPLSFVISMSTNYVEYPRLVSNVKSCKKNSLKIGNLLKVVKDFCV